MVRHGPCTEAVIDPCPAMLRKVSRAQYIIHTHLAAPLYTQLPIAMSVPCNCLSAAVRGLRPAATMRLPTAATRTYTTSTPITARRSAVASLSAQCTPSRPFSTSPSRLKLKTIQQIKARNKGGPFNITAAVLFVGAGAGLYAYFTYEKERLARKRIAEQTKGIGKPKVGGPFDLVDHNGRRFTNKDMEGRYALVRYPLIAKNPILRQPWGSY